MKVKYEDRQKQKVIAITTDTLVVGVDIALDCLNKIEESISRLEDFPMSGSIPRYSILWKQGYRVLIVKKYLVFYKVNETEKTVIIYAVVDGRQEYMNLI